MTAVGVGATLALILVLQGCSSSGASSGNASSGGGGATAGGGDTSAASSAAASAATITVDGVAFPKPEKSSVSMGVSSIDVGVMPTYLITEQQIAQKFGINLKIHDFNGEAPTLQAMIAGQIDVSAGSGGIAYSSHTTHDPAVITFVGDDTVTDILASQHDITSADSLKGKSIAVSSFGSYSYAEALLALKSLGLTPKDVTLTAVGHDSDRLAALKAHSVGASIQDATITGQLKSEGYNILVDLAKIKSAGYVGNAITVPESFAKKYPNTTLALTAMQAMGEVAFHKTNTAQVNSQIWAKVSDEKMSDATSDIQIQSRLPWHPMDGTCNASTNAFMKTVLLAANKALSSVDPSTICDNSYVAKLKQMGFFKAIGIPS